MTLNRCRCIHVCHTEPDAIGSNVSSSKQGLVVVRSQESLTLIWSNTRHVAHAHHSHWMHTHLLRLLHWLLHLHGLLLHHLLRLLRRSIWVLVLLHRHLHLHLRLRHHWLLRSFVAAQTLNYQVLGDRSVHYIVAVVRVYWFRYGRCILVLLWHHLNRWSLLLCLHHRLLNGHWLLAQI